MKRFCFAMLMVVLFTATVHAEKKDVSVMSADGFPLKATLYAAGRAGPGILLLHQCNADRQIYDTLGNMLSAAGYNALTLDFRGFGGSKNTQYPNLASARDKMPADVDAAFQFLSAQDQVNKTVMGVVGGSCGVNQAIQAARRHPEIKTLVLLSGGTDADGETFINNSAKMPVFGAASEEDTGAAASIKKIVGLSGNRDSKLTMLKGAGHAASMFEKEPDLQADIVIWFRTNLPVSGYAVLPSLK
jgi:dienelactone hydrolase